MKKYALIKRIFDFIFGVLSLLLLLPIIFFLSILIYFLDGHPVFFSQKRIGLNGKYFSLLKFRTMKNNSEKSHTGYYCYEGDPRITKLGRFLRKYSLDELPQIFNIIKGEMSFVGPRPAIHDELIGEKISINNKHMISKRVKVLPGLTGYSQVKARNDLSWDEKLNLDKKYFNYLEKIPFLIDFYIIFMTFSSILFPQGEYDKR